MKQIADKRNDLRQASASTLPETDARKKELRRRFAALRASISPEEKADALAARVKALLEELAARCAASTAHGWPLLMELEPQAPVLIERFLAPEAELPLS